MTGYGEVISRQSYLYSRRLLPERPPAQLGDIIGYECVQQNMHVCVDVRVSNQFHVSQFQYQLPVIYGFSNSVTKPFNFFLTCVDTFPWPAFYVMLFIGPLFRAFYVILK